MKNKPEVKYMDIKKIAKYWAVNGPNEQDLNFDWSDALETPLCFCCATRKRLEKAHIIPRALNGPDTVSNYVVLCNNCHKDAPDSINPDNLWHWIKSHKCSIYLSSDSTNSNLNRDFLLKSIYFESKINELKKLTNKQSKSFIAELKLINIKTSNHGYRVKPSTFKYFIDNAIEDSVNPKCNTSSFVINKRVTKKESYIQLSLL